MRKTKPSWYRFKAVREWEWEQELKMIKRGVDATMDRRERDMKAQLERKTILK